jgi:hypothetical protein
MVSFPDRGLTDRTTATIGQFDDTAARRSPSAWRSWASLATEKSTVGRQLARPARIALQRYGTTVIAQRNRLLDPFLIRAVQGEAAFRDVRKTIRDRTS